MAQHETDETLQSILKLTPPPNAVNGPKCPELVRSGKKVNLQLVLVPEERQAYTEATRNLKHALPSTSAVAKIKEHNSKAKSAKKALNTISNMVIAQQSDKLGDSSVLLPLGAGQAIYSHMQTRVKDGERLSAWHALNSLETMDTATLNRLVGVRRLKDGSEPEVDTLVADTWEACLQNAAREKVRVTRIVDQANPRLPKKLKPDPTFQPDESMQVLAALVSNQSKKAAELARSQYLETKDYRDQLKRLAETLVKGQCARNVDIQGIMSAGNSRYQFERVTPAMEFEDKIVRATADAVRLWNSYYNADGTLKPDAIKRAMQSVKLTYKQLKAIACAAIAPKKEILSAAGLVEVVTNPDVVRHLLKAGLVWYVTKQLESMLNPVEIARQRMAREGLENCEALRVSRKEPRTKGQPRRLKQSQLLFKLEPPGPQSGPSQKLTKEDFHAILTRMYTDALAASGQMKQRKPKNPPKRIQDAPEIQEDGEGKTVVEERDTEISAGTAGPKRKRAAHAARSGAAAGGRGEQDFIISATARARVPRDTEPSGKRPRHGELNDTVEPVLAQGTLREDAEHAHGHSVRKASRGGGSARDTAH